MTDERKPLLWHSNAPWSTTGYGTQTAAFAPKLSQHYRVGVSSFYGLEGSKLGWDEDVIVYPGLSGDFGNVSLPVNARSHFGDMKGGLVVTLMDVWVLNPQLIKQMNVASWVPVDHAPTPPRVMQYFGTSGAVPIAMSKFGRRELAEFDPLYCPHAIDTSIYKPIPKDEARKALGVPENKFVVGMVAANKGNPSRKCFQEALISFRAFHEKHPDAILYLHTEMSGRFEGVNLLNLLSALGMPDDAVFFADQEKLMFDPFSSQMMVALYSSFDVLLSPSAGEGFGIPVLEAQACGVPAIVTDFSAQTEVCGAGWKVQWEPIWTAQESWQAKPSIEDIENSLNSAYEIPEKQRAAMSQKAVRHAKGYDIDVVMEKYMLPALAAAEERLTERPVELVPEMAA